MQVVYLNEARVSIFTGLIDHQMVLRPGRNVVDDKLFHEVNKRSEEFRNQCEAGIIVVQGETVDIVKLSVPKAMKVIDMEVSVQGVEELLDQENSAEKPRKTVVDAMIAKIETIRSAEKEPSSNAAVTQKAQLQDGGAN